MAKWLYRLEYELETTFIKETSLKCEVLSVEDFFAKETK